MKHALSRRRLLPLTALSVLGSCAFPALPAFAQEAKSFTPEILVHFTDGAGSYPGGTSLAPPLPGKTPGVTEGLLYGVAYNNGTIGGRSHGHIWRLDPAAPATSYQATEIASVLDAALPALGGKMFGGFQGTLVENSQGQLFTGERQTLFTAANHGRAARITQDPVTGALVYEALSEAAGQATSEDGSTPNFVNPFGPHAVDAGDNVYFWADSRAGTARPANTKLLIRRDAEGGFRVLLDLNTQRISGPAEQDYTWNQHSGLAMIYSEADAALYILVDRQGRDGSSAISNSTAIGRIDLAAASTDGATPVQFIASYSHRGAVNSHEMNTLVETGDWLYGIAGQRTGNDLGVIWRVRKDGTGYALVHEFTLFEENAEGNQVASDGRVPYGPLVVGLDGNIYGTTTHGASNAGTAANSVQSGFGTIWRVVVGSASDRSDDQYQRLHSFPADGANAPAGRHPTGLSLGAQTRIDGVPSGVLYGSTVFGGAQDAGVVYRLAYPLPAPQFTTALTPSLETAVNGDTVTLSWNARNAASCTAGGDNGGTWSGEQPVSGESVSVGPLSLIGVNTFTLSCASPFEGFEPAVSEASVQVNAPAQFTTALTPSDGSVTVGASITLNWATANTEACVARGDNAGLWSGEQPVSGNAVTIGPLTEARDYTFSLSCASTYEGGPAAESSVTVAASNPPVDGGDSGSGGGGSFAPTLLLMLGAYGMWRRRAGAMR
jgi:MYXO-CTERM domain-containing protein